MISRKYLLSILSTLAATSLLLTACGEETLKCGGGTVEKSGKCVAQTPDTLECGPGTELDAEGKKCVPSEAAPAIECGPGTVLENNACIAEVTCNDDQTAVGGFCLSPAEALAESPDVQNIDQPFELQLPGEDEQFIFTGTIDAPVEIDDELAQNTDSFTFQGQAGQWLEITLQSLGLPAPAFKIEAVIGEDDEPFTYERYSPFGAAAVARHIVLPHDGTYKVTILPEQSFSHEGPFGDASWKYVGTLKHAIAPVATAIELINDDETGQNLSGTATVLPLNFYEIQTADKANTVQLTINQADKNVLASVLVFSDLHTLLASYEGVYAGQVIEFPASNAPAYVLVDWIQTDGPAQNYNIQARSMGMRAPLLLGARSSQTLSGFSAPENTIIKLSLAGSSVYPIDLSVLDADGNLLGKVRDVKAAGNRNTTELVNFAFYSAGGDFSVQADNDSDIDHDTSLVIELIKPTPVGDLAPNSVLNIQKPLPPRSFNFFMIESAEEFSVLKFGQLNDRMFYEGLIELTVHEADGSILLDGDLMMSDDDANVIVNAPVNTGHYMANSGPFVVQIENFEHEVFDPFTFSISATSTTTIQTNDSAGLKAGESIEHIHTQPLATGAEHWLRLVVAETIELTALLSALPPGDVDIKGYTTDFRLFLLAEQAGNDPFDVRIPAGTYLLAVSAHAGSDDGYKLSASTDAGYLTTNESPQQSTFADAVKITEIPARINGSAFTGIDGPLQYWKFTATHDTTIALNLTHLGGSFGMQAFVYNQDQTTVHARTTDPMGITPTIDNRRSYLNFPVITGETYFLVIGGEEDQEDSSKFTYTVKITDPNP